MAILVHGGNGVQHILGSVRRCRAGEIQGSMHVAAAVAKLKYVASALEKQIVGERSACFGRI